MIEGIVVGAAGALLAVAVLGVTKIALLDPLANNWTLIAAPRTISFTALLAVLMAAGVGVSALGFRAVVGALPACVALLKPAEAARRKRAPSYPG